MRTVNPDLQAYAFINRADPAGRDNQEAAEIIQETPELEFIDLPLGSRKAFSNAAAKGLGVVEYKPADAKAVNEITALYEYLYDTK